MHECLGTNCGLGISCKDITTCLQAFIKIVNNYKMRCRVNYAILIYRFNLFRGQPFGIKARK